MTTGASAFDPASPDDPRAARPDIERAAAPPATPATSPNGSSASTEPPPPAPAPSRAPSSGPGGADGRPPRGKPRFSLRTFESLNDTNYRWYFMSLFGHFAVMNAQMFIRGYLVFELTGSYAMLGMISLANAMPGIVFSLVGGVVADRVRSKKRLVQMAQAVNVVNTTAIGVLLAFGQLDVWHLVASAALQGGVMSLMMPARQVLTQEVVGTDRLMNALALNTAGMNVNRLIMPAAAGGLMAAFSGGTGVEGAQYVYFMMSGMYLMSMVTLHFVVAPDVVRSRGYSLGQALGELVDGFVYIRRDRVVLMLLIVNLLVVMGSMPYLNLLPGFAKSVLGTDAGSLGLLMSIQGIGSLFGSLVIASLPNRNRGRMLLLASAMVGVTLVMFSASTAYWLSALILIAVGVAQAGRMALGQVLIQTYTEDQYRGRVQSIYFMEMSLMQFATFGVGLLANVIGPQWAIGGTAGLVLAVSVATLLFVPRFRNLA